MNSPASLLTLAVAATLLTNAGVGLSGAAPDIIIVKPRDSLGFLQPIPVNVSGFNGEADSVLKFDLLFMGVIHVPLEQAGVVNVSLRTEPTTGL